MDAPLVSVILPTYNRGSLIETAIDSVLAQGVADLELIVIDDGSTDDTEQVVGRIEDERIRYHRLETNRGQSAARNEGLRRARGQFVAFQDSDDRWAPEKLDRFMPVLRDAPPDVGCVYSDMRRWRADGSSFYVRSPTIERGRWISRDTGWYQASRLGIQATMMPRRWLEAVGPFDEALRYYSDMELLLRLALVADFVHISEPLTDYIATPGSVVTDRRQSRRSRQHILRQHGRALLRESPGFVVRECLGILRAWLRV